MYTNSTMASMYIPRGVNDWTVFFNAFSVIFCRINGTFKSNGLIGWLCRFDKKNLLSFLSGDIYAVPRHWSS